MWAYAKSCALAVGLLFGLAGAAEAQDSDGK